MKKGKDSHFEELTTLFFEMRQVLKREMHGEGKRLDPNVWLRLEALRFIDRSDGPTMRDIARFLCTQAPSATSLVQHMEKLDLVERRRQESDKRIVRLYLTKEGRRLLARYTKHSAEGMRLVFGKLPAHDIEELKRILADMLRLHEESR